MQVIKDLDGLPKEALLDLWRKLPGNPAPPARVDRLLRELAYRLQEQEYGRLDKNTAVSLRRHMAEFKKSLASQKPVTVTVKTPPKVLLEPGSVLSRHWEGRRITVQVASSRQFVWEGETFKSLSALARRITGQHLSGPLFFGLKEENYD